MENTDPAMSADRGFDDVLELGEALKTILALGPDAVPSAHSGQTVWDGLEQIQRIINDSLIAHLNGGADESVKAAYRAGRASVEALIEAVGQEVRRAAENDKADAADPEDSADAVSGAAQAPDLKPVDDTQDSQPDPDAGFAGDGQQSPMAIGHGHEDLSPVVCVSTVLHDLWASLAADDETAVFAADYRLDDDPNADQADLARQRWERLHLVCLRIGSEMAGLWRQEAYERISAKLQENGHEPQTVAGDGGAQPEIPALPEIEYRGTAPWSTETGLPEQLAKSAEGLGERWLPLARYAAIAYWLDGHDPQLYGGLAVVHTTDRELSPPGTRSESYRKELIARVGDLAREHEGDYKELSRAVSVDEAIRGLVPIPFPVRGSWWTEFNQGLEETITKQLSQQIFVPDLHIAFSSISRQVEQESPQVSRELVRKYRLSPGVFWLLRLGYPEHMIPKKSKARVVYVSSG
jgi:hypothetical protein